MLKLTNTLDGKKETFKSLKPDSVGMYNCGPTVYNYVHVGNLRSYVFADILRRTLEMNGFFVKQVINITDIGHLSSDNDEGEDKMTKGLKREGKPLTLEAMRELASFYTDRFIDDLRNLNIKLPTYLPKASEHIEEDIELISKLQQKDLIYKTSDGLYFNTSRFPNYGRLGNLNKASENEISRIGVNSEKKNQRDFAVWKFNDTLGYESPWGKGFPGWHIECSAMSMKYLGENFDIHTGGIDHISVHHNNEIAQSESATGKPYANFWLHNAFVNVESGKMAKSEGNFIRLQTLKENGISPLGYRYWLLTARYSTPITFSWEALNGAEKTLARLNNVLLSFRGEGEVDRKYADEFIAILNDDLDTPRGLAILWDILKDQNISDANKRETIFAFDAVLGLSLKDTYEKNKNLVLPEKVLKLSEEREEARKNKNWKKSDELRTEIEKEGFEVKDTESGPKITKK